MAPSSCLISGVFPLSEGSRNADPSYYVTYLSALEFINDENFINVSIRKYTASTDILHADGSFVYMVAKAALPAGEDGMLDSIHCTPFIPPSGGFQPCYPPEPTHTVFVTGTISGVDNGTSVRSFTLTTSEYVRDERRTFNVRFKFDGSSNRWKNVRLPAVGSTVSATGIFEDISDHGYGEPILNLLDMSYGSSETVVSSPTRTIGHRRKAGRSSVEPNRSSSPPASVQPSIEANVDVIGSGNVSRTAKKRVNKVVEEAEEGTSQPSKRPRTRKNGKA